MLRSLPAAFVFVLTATSADAQVAIGRLLGTVTYTLPNTSYPQTIRLTGWVAYLDIAGGRLQPIVTPPLAEGCPSPNDVRLQTTVAFAQASRTVVAINANLGPGLSTYVPGTCGQPYGFLVSNGSVVNAFQPNGPTLAFTANTSATISAPPAAPPKTTYAVAGWAGTNGTGTLLVVPSQSGPQVGSNILPASSTIAPRVGAGITADGTLLILAMIDGLEPNLGLQNPDFGNVMIGLGANAAVNLDGGGSSTFVFVPPPGATLKVPAAARALMTKAGAPAGAGNGLWFSIVDRALTRPWISDPPCATPCAYRAIYANLGFVLAGGGATRTR